MEMPFTTCEPSHGGTNTGLSVSTSGDREGSAEASTSRFSRFGRTRPVSSRPNSGSLSSPAPFLSVISRSMVRRPSKASLP